MKPATFLIASASKITPGWSTDGIASNATVTPIKPSSPMFIGFEYDINEAVWGAIELDWKKMNNRCSTSVGRNIWVASGYDTNLVGYMFVVEKLERAAENDEPSEHSPELMWCAAHQDVFKVLAPAWLAIDVANDTITIVAKSEEEFIAKLKELEPEKLKQLYRVHTTMFV